jgi:hypothetical protein
MFLEYGKADALMLQQVHGTLVLLPKKKKPELELVFAVKLHMLCLST